MAQQTRKNNRRRNTKLENFILPTLLQADRPMSLKEIEQATGTKIQPLYVFNVLEGAEKGKTKAGETALLRRDAEPVRSGKQGRPANRYRLTDAGRKRARRLAEQAQKAQAPAPVEIPVEPVEQEEAFEVVALEVIEVEPEEEIEVREGIVGTVVA